ncbi:MAG: hypothetical protein CMJ79_07930 [Planctomycetaceae bacterium]|nr:hypothetical protein [Planctomycetaceae bacterium]
MFWLLKKKINKVVGKKAKLRAVSAKVDPSNLPKADVTYFVNTNPFDKSADRINRMNRCREHLIELMNEVHWKCFEYERFNKDGTERKGYNTKWKAFCDHVDYRPYEIPRHTQFRQFIQSDKSKPHVFGYELSIWSEWFSEELGRRITPNDLLFPKEQS